MSKKFSEWSSEFSEFSHLELMLYVTDKFNAESLNEVMALRERFMDTAFHALLSTREQRIESACWIRVIDGMILLWLMNDLDRYKKFLDACDSCMTHALDFGYGSVNYIAFKENTDESLIPKILLVESFLEEEKKEKYNFREYLKNIILGSYA